MLKHKDLSGRVIEVFYAVYNELGCGFLESVYEQAMFIALQQAGLHVQRQAEVCVHFRGHIVGTFRADLIIEGKLLVEIKAVRAIDPAHEAQILNYLRATSIEIGLLFNFGPEPEFKRFAYDNTRKPQMNSAADQR